MDKIETRLIEKGNTIKCHQCGCEDWMKKTKYSISAYCKKCDAILEFKPEK